jgi:hypothetical protein
VLDCCQGSGILWSRLRAEFPCDSYLGLDLKAQKGRLRLDSARYLALPGWDHDVVDIDTWGSPWNHYFNLLPNLMGPTTVFLTIGQRITGTVGRMADDALGALGLGKLGKRLPLGFHVKLAGIAVSYCLTRSCVNGIILAYAAEACSANRNARYLGVRLEPGNKAGPTG